MTEAMNIFEQEPDGDTIGGRLSRARDASGLSVREFAWQLGVKIATVKAWESDRSLPSSHRLANVSGILGVSLSWLLHGIGIAPREPDDDAPTADLAAQFEQLRAMHAQTGAMIARLQSELSRTAAR